LAFARQSKERSRQPIDDNIKTGCTYPTRRLYGRILGSNHGKHYLAQAGTRPNLAEGRACAFSRIVGAFVTFIFHRDPDLPALQVWYLSEAGSDREKSYGNEREARHGSIEIEKGRFLWPIAVGISVLPIEVARGGG
jgi:hypothetical protein